MSQVQNSAMHIWQNAETITVDKLEQNRSVLQTAINDTDSKANTNATNISNLTSGKSDKTYVDNQLAGKQNVMSNAAILAIIQNAGTPTVTTFDLATTTNNITTNTNNISTLFTQKADKTYVDQQIANTQAGMLSPGSVQTATLADGAVTTPKMANASVTTAKLATAAVTSAIVDGTTVYTASQVDAHINTAQTNLQGQINTNNNTDTNLQGQINNTNTRIDSLQYNHDLYGATRDIINLYMNVEALKGARATGVVENMVIESLFDTTDLIITYGTYDSTNKRIYLP